MKENYEIIKIFNSGTLHKHIPSVQVRAKIDCKVLAFLFIKLRTISDYFLYTMSIVKDRQKEGGCFFEKRCSIKKRCTI